jgi:hypothetical protein
VVGSHRGYHHARAPVLRLLWAFRVQAEITRQLEKIPRLKHGGYTGVEQEWIEGSQKSIRSLPSCQQRFLLPLPPPIDRQR